MSECSVVPALQLEVILLLGDQLEIYTFGLLPELQTLLLPLYLFRFFYYTGLLVLLLQIHLADLKVLLALEHLVFDGLSLVAEPNLLDQITPILRDDLRVHLQCS